MQHRVYFDSASTTAIHPEVLRAYIELLNTEYVNSESLYSEGAKVNRMLEKARQSIADLLGVKTREVIFTSGSSESNSSAIKGVCMASPERRHIITTQIEHSSVLNACEQMERLLGYRVTYLPVNENGIVSADCLLKELDEDTVLVSVMHVNNETGAINPIKDISEIVKKNSHAYMHVDMTQSMGKMECSFNNIDLASIAAHKLEGLKGSGLLIKKQHVPFEPLINGGEQEFGLRGGTNNASVNMVMAKTLRLALENEREYQPLLKEMHDRMISGLAQIPGVIINSPAESLDCIVNFSYEGIPSEVMQNALNEKGFMVSARSTCKSRSTNTSYVLKAMGFSDTRASSCIRLSFCYHNRLEEIDEFLISLKEIISHYGKV